MDDITNPHDKFVREILSRKETAQDFFSGFLNSDILKTIDLDTIRITKDTFIDANLKEYQSDLLYQVHFKDHEGYIYLLFEHKSHKDHQVALQLLNYMVNIWKQHLSQTPKKPLPVIIPMVLYHGRQKWDAAASLGSLLKVSNDIFEKYIPNFEFILFDLSRYSDDELKRNVRCGASLLLLKYIFSPKLIEKLPDIISLFLAMEKQETGLKSLETFMTYLFNATDALSAETFVEIAKKSVSDAKGEAIMTLAEQFFEKGKQAGILEGKREGILEGKLEGMLEGERKGKMTALFESIELTLSLKFEDVDAEYLEQLKKIQDIDQLREIFKKIQLADTLDDITDLFI